MANFQVDQAEGLRRMLAGPTPRVVSFVSVLGVEEKSAMLVNLASSLTRAGSDVLLLDACSASNGLAQRLGAASAATLLQVARQERGLNEVVRQTAQGFRVATMARERLSATLQDAQQARRLANAFGVLATQSDILLVDAELAANDRLPVPAMQQGEIVVQVSAERSAITAAYTLIKRMHAQFGRRPFGIVVSGASNDEAQQIYENMADVAQRYLSVPLHLVGSVPADPDLRRAMQLGRSIGDAFPMARAAVAFRGLAHCFINVESGSLRRSEFA